MKEHYHHTHSLPAYSIGFFLAAGIEFATSHDWFSTLWHALLSWASVGYYIAETIQHFMK